MPVLLLCQGDPEAKDLLRRAIESRYGINPPAIESLRIDFTGRARIKLGPIRTWVPVEATASFVFPTHLRWDFVVKPLGLSIQRGIEAFDGSTYRMARGNNLANQLKQTDIIASARGRLWSMAAILLTPMSDHYIKISNCGEYCIEAANTELKDSVRLELRDNYTIDFAQVECLNPDTNRLQQHTLQLADEQNPIGDLMLPAKVSAYWDDELFYEMEPVAVDLNAEFDEDWFSLGMAASSSY